MKGISGVVIVLLVFFCLNVNLGYCGGLPLDSIEAVTKTVDINKDGKPDVTYYSDGKYIARAEADTNYDGKPDVVVYAENGKFKSAEVETNYDGKPDKKFDNSAQFKKWVNENHPDFNDSLGWDDYSRTISKVFWEPGANNQ